MWYYIISISLTVIGFIVCLLLIHRKKKARAIEHYEDIRDELTLRKKKKPIIIEDEENGGGLGLGNLIGGFIVILVGLSLLPTISEELKLSMEQTENISELNAMLLDLIPMFFGIGIAIAGIAIAAQALRAAGLFGV